MNQNDPYQCLSTKLLQVSHFHTGVWPHHHVRRFHPRVRCIRICWRVVLGWHVQCGPVGIIIGISMWCMPSHSRLLKSWAYYNCTWPYLVFVGLARICLIVLPGGGNIHFHCLEKVWQRNGGFPTLWITQVRSRGISGFFCDWEDGFNRGTSLFHVYSLRLPRIPGTKLVAVLSSSFLAVV